MNLKLISSDFSVCNLLANADVPAWALQSSVFFLSKTSDELSLVCPTADIPIVFQVKSGWRCFRVDGELAFKQVGVVASVSTPIANAGLSLLLVSTHDRDYVLVHKSNLDEAIQVYEEHGFSVTTES